MNHAHDARATWNLIMAMLITYPDGSTEIIARATKVDPHNFHEGMYDFYDDGGALLVQIDMYKSIKWELIDEPESRE